MKLDFIIENGEEYVLISEQIHVYEIVKRITEQKLFAFRFRFSDRQLFIALLEDLNIKYDYFTTKYYYYDPTRKLHISESEFGYVWISTAGLVASKKSTTNSAVNSCLNQYTVVKLLLNNAIEIVKNEKVYDIDSYNFGLLSNLSPAIFHNIVFYIEVFFKAYLSLTGVLPPHTHKLSLIYQKTVEIMTNNGHDDTLFQILILDPLYKFVDHLRRLPGNFKEQFIKYDDNPDDDTAILFDLVGLNEMQSLLELSVDFINEYYYMGTQTHYLESNVFQRMLNKAGTDEEKKRIFELYPHLAEKYIKSQALF